MKKKLYIYQKCITAASAQLALADIYSSDGDPDEAARCAREGADFFDKAAKAKSEALKYTTQKVSKSRAA